MKYKSQKELYQDVYRAMDACNSSGLIHSFPDIVAAIGEFEGIRGACVNGHPIVVLMVDKLAQLAGFYLSDATNNKHLESCYKEVREVAEREV